MRAEGGAGKRRLGLAWLDFHDAPSLWDDVAAAANRHRARTALRFGAESWSYGDLLREASRIRDWLETELGEGPILVAPRNEPRHVAVILGAIGSGRVPLLADPAWTPAELEPIVERCRVRALVYDAADPEPVGCERRSSCGTLRLATVRRAERDDGWSIPPGTSFGRFTSGTTGLPRCLAFSDAAALAAAADWAATARISSADRVLCLATLSNGLAFNTSLFAVLLAGGTLAFHSGRLLPRALARTLAATSSTVLVGFPFLYEQLVQAGGDRAPCPPTVRLAISSAARLAPATRDAWRALTGLAICDYYGLAEVGPCTFNDGARPDTVGKPLRGVSIRVTDERGAEVPPGTRGRIRVRTSSMALAFLDGEDPPLADDLDGHGYYVTKDTGMLLATGELALAGRVGRLVNVAGRKIEPAEVEDCLRALPGVRDALVRGEPVRGATVLAAYVESDTVAREQVVGHCRSRLAPYKVPQLITILGRLPRSSSGKVSVGRMVARAGGAK